VLLLLSQAESRPTGEWVGGAGIIAREKCKISALHAEAPARINVHMLMGALRWMEDDSERERELELLDSAPVAIVAVSNL
jgi:hypothetical protein